MTVLISAGLTLVIGIFGTPVIERHFRKLTDPLFFKDTYRYAEAMNELTQILNRNLETQVIISESKEALTRILRAEHVTFLFLAKAADAQKDDVQFLDDIWSNKNEKLSFKGLVTVSELPYRKEYVVASTEMWHKIELLKHLGKTHHAELIVPIILEDDLLGVLFVGLKRSGDPYGDEDRSLLTNFSSQIAVAFEKALLYEQVATYSANLE
jgi:GAF domain-containing protein